MIGLLLSWGHSPWLGQYYLLLPGVDKEMQRFKAFAKSRAAIRIAQGSVTMDAFYHFVSIVDLAERWLILMKAQHSSIQVAPSLTLPPPLRLYVIACW